MYAAPNLKPGQVVAMLQVKVYEDGALSVEGPMDDPAWCIAALQNAIDAIRNKQRPAGEIIVPGKDVSLT